MVEYSGRVTAPLDWPALVKEAVRRRKKESLTQKEFAALAGLSVPTLIAFERGETTLSLGKAIAILQVVGLVAEQPLEDAQDSFVAAAQQRWRQLITGLPSNAAARQPQGHYAFDYEIMGATRLRSTRALLDSLRKAEVKYTGWPPFWIPEREAIAPYVVDEMIECWLGKPDADPDANRVFADAAHSDFWRASPDGRLYLQRGYQEDSADALEPGTIFDLTLPVWRAGEALLHAASLAGVLTETPEAAGIHFRATYTGLTGRDLAAWSNPRGQHAVLGTHRSRTDAVTVSVAGPAGAIEEHLGEILHRLLSPLYDRFDFFQLAPALVEQEVALLRAARNRF
jgi:transcriptional regulator with XRE-family HTH domain